MTTTALSSNETDKGASSSEGAPALSSRCRILSIEDNEDIQAVLKTNLELAGYQALTATNGLDGLKLAETHPVPSLIILDVMLPDISGIEVCRRLRENPATSAVPVVMLTARGEEIERVVGFEAGADDYVVKPFILRELLLRIKAIIRRSSTTETQSVFQDGSLKANWSAYQVWVEDRPIALTPLEFRLLKTLCTRRGRVQSRGTLLADVWESSPDITTRTVDTHIRRLREKLGVAGSYVRTVRGVGYRFNTSEG